MPSLPGVAFSQTPDDEVRGLRFTSRRIRQLMTNVLGHERYLGHGGDHGAVVADWLAIDTPQNVIGVHANMIAFRHAGAEFGSGKTGLRDAKPEETRYVKAEEVGRGTNSPFAQAGQWLDASPRRSYWKIRFTHRAR